MQSSSAKNGDRCIEAERPEVKAWREKRLTRVKSAGAVCFDEGAE